MNAVLFVWPQQMGIKKRLLDLVSAYPVPGDNFILIAFIPFKIYRLREVDCSHVSIVYGKLHIVKGKIKPPRQAVVLLLENSYLISTARGSRPSP